jgi:OmpA-OmpF porin, OOP family
MMFHRPFAGLAERASRCALGPLLALLALACAHQAQLDGEVERISRALVDVEAAGALRCAPRELAVARSQLEFALLERDQGSPSRAREHLAAADENVRAARVLSPPAQCAAARLSPATLPPEAPRHDPATVDPVPGPAHPERCAAPPCPTGDAGS